MKVDDVAKTLPTPSPTIAAAGAAGIKIGEDSNEFDANTGLKKKIETTPAIPGEVVESVKDTTVITDSVGNVIVPTGPTKEELLAAETQKILRKRKAEAMAEKYNAEVDEKINSIKSQNYQKTTIESVFQEVKTETAVNTLNTIKTMALREKNKRPDLDDNDWASNMPEHWQKEGDDTTKGIKPVSSSIVINATSAASVLSTGVPTVAGAEAEIASLSSPE